MTQAGEESMGLRFVKRWLRPNSLVKALSGVAVIWCFLPARDTTAIKIHKRFHRQCWKEDGATGVLILCAGFGAWLPVLIYLIAVYTGRCGMRVRRQTGIGISRQVAGQLTVACRYAVPPPWFYMFEFYRPERRRRALEYLYRTETKGSIYNMLRKRLSSLETLNALSDKALFARHCRDAGLSVLPVVALARRGMIECIEGGHDVLRRDLFFKPRKGAGGRGASRWLYRGHDEYQDEYGNQLNIEALRARLRRLSRHSDYIVRPYVHAHAAIARISGSALSTVRVVTALDPQANPRATHAVLRMARAADVVVDNFHVGGIAAAIDLDSGRLGRATDMGLRADSRWYRAHPLTGAAIENTRIPFWTDVLDLARRAHAIFNDQIAVGWDIAVLEDGAYLVEGNKGPDLDIIQRTYESPVGNTALGASLLHYLDIALARAPVPADRRPRRAPQR